MATTSPGGTGHRDPLDGAALAAWAPSAGWRELRVVGSTASTNADLVALAGAGEPAGLVLVAEEQTSGRGRLDRTWTSPPRAGLTFSVLLRPVREPARLGWLPLLAGLSVAEAVSRTSGLDVRLKWPNDLLVGDRKLAGLLAERTGDAVVVGVGLNVTLTAAERPVPEATSLLLEGSATADRTEVLRAVLGRLGERLAAWDEHPSAGRDRADAALRSDYRAACASLGHEVRAELPGAPPVEGTAEDVDELGRLVLATAAGPVAVAAGDVIIVR